MTRLIRSACIALLAALTLAGNARGQDAPAADDAVIAAGTITDVLLYEDRALVTRRAEVDLPAGRSLVRFDDLPGIADPDSVRARGRGPGAATLVGLETRTGWSREVSSERVRAVEEALDAAESRLAAIRDEISVLEEEWKFLTGLRAATAERTSRALGDGRAADLDDLRATLRFVTEEMTRNRESRRDATDRAEEAGEAVTDLQRELQQVRNPAGRQVLKAALEVEIAAAGTYTFDLQYMVGACGWAPSYDARVFPAEDRVEMAWYGRVAQRTGENWDGVRLTLSTARPRLGAKRPELAQWPLSLQPPVTNAAPGMSMGRASRESADRAMALDAEADGWSGDDARAPAEAPATEMGELTAHAESRGGVTAVFQVPRRADIPADGEVHRVTLRLAEHSAAFTHEAAPELAEFAYLTAEIVNDGEVPMLAGPMSVFLGTDYLGRSAVETVAPGASFTAHLGVDESVQVRRTVMEEETGSSGLLGRRDTWEQTVRLEVTNRLDRPTTVILLDRRPVSRDEDVKVDWDATLEPEKPADDEEKAAGILRWRLRLEPGETRTVTLDLDVSWPSDETLRGLDR